MHGLMREDRREPVLYSTQILRPGSYFSPTLRAGLLFYLGSAAILCWTWLKMFGGKRRG